MSKTTEESKVAAATQTLAFVHAQTDAARAQLTKVRGELARVQEELDGLRTAKFTEVSDELVQAAVHADAIAQTVVGSLDEWQRHTQHDELTGAPNRALMLDRIATAISMAQRRSMRLSVLFLDLDHFKQINDTMGHGVGDQVLQLTTRRLQSAVRESDTVSRHSGDEFLVLLAEIHRGSDAAVAAEKILAALAAPAVIGHHTLSLSASVGVVVYPEDGEDAATLIDRADVAMYRSKKRGHGGYAFYNPATQALGDTSPAPMEVPTLDTRPPEAAIVEHQAQLRELLRANKQLVVAAQTAQKLQANAEAAHQRQINFVAMASHAMRNPLGAIQMAAATAAHPKINAASRADQHGIIQRQAGHMARLITDLLDGSRVGAREFNLQRHVLQLESIVSAAVDACQHAFDAKYQQLRVDLPNAPSLPINGDPERLIQVFSNLLRNASRRTPNGGDLSLMMRAGPEQVTVTVADSGPRITAEALPHIFDLFSVDPSVPTDDTSLGIGLAVAHELVKAHGGTIRAASKGADDGSEFTVKLPVIPQARAG